MHSLTADGGVAAAMNLAAGGIVLLIGAGVVLHERFSRASARFALLTSLLGMSLLCFGMFEATEGSTAIWWYRRALAADSLVAAAVYTLALFLVRVQRPWVTRAAWSGAVGLATWSFHSPALYLGVVTIGTDAHRLADTSLAGGLFIAFVVTLVLATVAELAWSGWRAEDEKDRRTARVLAVGFGIGAASLVDLFIYPQLFWGAGLTPVAATAAASIVGFAAMRFRVFSPLPSFATERILDVMGDGVLLCDPAGRIRNANRAARRMFGVSEAELRGRPLASVIRQGEADGALAASLGMGTDAMVAGLALRDEYAVLMRADGGTIDVSVSSEPLQRRGAVLGNVIVFRDVTDRKQLSITEQKYHLLFWNNPAMAYEISPTGLIVQANTAVQRFLGFEGAELRTRSFVDFIHPDELDRSMEVFREVMSGKPAEYRMRLMASDGTALEIKGVSIPIVRHGAVAGIFGMAVDISEEVRVRRELEVQRREFAEFFESSPEAILIADEDSVIHRINPEFCRMFGYTEEEVLGRTIRETIVPADRLAESDAFDADAADGSIVRSETVRRRADGTLIDVSLLARQLSLPGRPPQLYGIYRDISQQRHAELALRDRDEQLRHAQRLESVGKLAGGIAHDFNNLVTVINGHVRFALDSLEEWHPARRDMEQIEQAGSRAANLTQQLLAFSRRQLLRPETVDAASVITDVQRMLNRLIGEHIRFETTHAGTALVRVDRGQLEQLLVNLVVNARDAMADGGHLVVSTEPVHLTGRGDVPDDWDAAAGDYVRISVADSGTGMDEATRARAFDPFFTTKAAGKGTGLGLASVFGIAKQSGGHVTIESTLGAGTTVHVWLPATTEATGPGTVDARPAAEADGRAGARVLVVEDEAALRDLAARVLRRSGYDVIVASDGVDGLVQLESNPVDVLVSDLIMPRMGGRELARRVRGLYPDMAIVLMSGYDDEVVHGAVAENILAKPFSPGDLVRRVNDALAAAA